ncbi:YCF48-related protein [Mangrovimonas spongiae]|uniref:T9SS C-terminal target domain-containing protein n=1 Tax=Mangrovimonas spongiae TaxID=2494697 RepID=A0A3R9M9Q4_9FLAO|nr:YCF48-related protein [Mangrovimonas spongiae]RSK40610.1 T9SS C-terminal target domain-containing protein [Mangrovimonas spongiae]
MKPLHLILFLFSISLHSQTWQSTSIANNANNQRFDDVFFLNETTGWAANGYYAAVYKTIDGGITWTEQLNESDLGGSYYFRNIEFLNDTIGFLGTLNGEFFKTTDGGQNWTEVSLSPNPQAICGLDTVGSSTIYGCGAYFTPAHIIKSTDSGTTWNVMDMSAYATALVEVLFHNEMLGYASGRNNTGGCILKTTDGGQTWTEIYNTNIPGEYVWKLQILDDSNIIFGSVSSVASNPGKLVKSLDNGNNWLSYDAPETDVQAVGFINANTGWMGGHNTGFHQTNDGGVTWNNINVGGNLNRIFVINENLAYAAGTTIYKFTEETLNTDNHAFQDSQKLNIKLNKNPVISHLNLTIEFSDDDNVLIELYDTNGQYIKQLSRDTNILAGTTRNYKFDVQSLSSGMYFVDIHNNFQRQSLKFIKQ